MLNGAEIAQQFPLLSRLSPSGHKTIYLDSAATALKPQPVVDAVHKTLTEQTANIHRSVHFLGDEATEAYESTRSEAAAFINAEEHEIVFLRNATEGLNLVAKGFKHGKRVLCSVAEHHSNMLPWDTVQCTRLNISQDGHIDEQQLEQELAKGDVGLVSLAHASNVTGNILDVKRIADLVHGYGAKLMVDAAQSAPHTPIDVYEFDCDFLVFSGHKLGAPTGVGVLYGKAELLNEMDFYLQGGSTINEVHADHVVVKTAPWKFEAGTPAIESVIGLNAALVFLQDLGMDEIHAHFKALSHTTFQKSQEILGDFPLLGSQSPERCGPFSFRFDGISPHVIARGLSDRYGICVRSGFHCAQPLHTALNAPASLRLSFWIYNTVNEIELALSAMRELADMQRRH